MTELTNHRGEDPHRQNSPLASGEGGMMGVTLGIGNVTRELVFGKV